MTEYRKLTSDDLEQFISIRIKQLREEGAVQDVELAPQLLSYYQKHLADNTFCSWIALKDKKIIATSGISFVEKPPYFSNPNGKIGLLSSMYTQKEFRRRGIARHLLDLLIHEAQKYECNTIQITASDMGVLLYTNYGFEKNENFMQYSLK